MGLFKKKHRHSGKAIGTRVISWYYAFSERPSKWTTEVRSICEECGQPFVVEYRGKFDTSDFENATIRQK